MSHVLHKNYIRFQRNRQIDLIINIFRVWESICQNYKDSDYIRLVLFYIGQHILINYLYTENL